MHFGLIVLHIAFRYFLLADSRAQDLFDLESIDGSPDSDLTNDDFSLLEGVNGLFQKRDIMTLIFRIEALLAKMTLTSICKSHRSLAYG